LTLWRSATNTLSIRIKLLDIVCGTADDHLALTRQFRDFLKAKQIKSNYVEAPEAGHVWPLWRRQLAEMAQMPFQPQAK
jgi:esterase/lipase superfamily enzyme